MSYSIAPLSLDNIADLVFLYKNVFGNQVSVDMVKRKFDTSYLMEGYFGHIAYDKEQPVAFHGAVPILMEYNKKQELAAQYGDAMTLPQHTGKGLFTTLGKLTDEKLSKANVKFVWGFPNQNSEYGYMNKLNWKYKERMQRFHIKAALVPLEKLARKFRITSQVYDEHIMSTFKKYETALFIEGSIHNTPNAVSCARNTAYYKYKEFNENFTIKINDVLFWIKIKNGLSIGDIDSPSPAQFDIAFEKLRQLAVSTGIDSISIQSSPSTPICQLMKNYTKESFPSWAVGYKNFTSEFPLNELKMTLGDLDTF